MTPQVGFSLGYVALWLWLFLPVVEGVCGSCFGTESTCTDNGYSNCPWQRAAIANTAALAATGVAVISMTLLLPVRLLRLFSPGALSALVGLYRRPREGKDYDLTAASPKSMVAAVNSKYCDRNEAMMECSSRLMDLDPSHAAFDVVKCGLQAALEVLKCMDNTLGSSSQEAGTEGALTYILARLSGITNKADSLSFEFNVLEAERDSSKNASSSSTSSRFSANLTRAKTLEQVCSLLNLFVLVACSAGVTSLQLISPFLDEVFYEPIRTKECAWPVAFEMILLYLHKVETNPSMYNLANVVHSVGGLDTNRKVATKLAEGLYPKAVVDLFRAPRVEPRDVTKEGEKTGDKKFAGTLAGYNTASTKGCVVHNLGGQHLAKYVDKNKCRFFHGCDQYVTDKGPAGQCLSTDHVRGDCTYDSSKKCSQPLK